MARKKSKNIAERNRLIQRRAFELEKFGLTKTVILERIQEEFSVILYEGAEPMLLSKATIESIIYK